MRTVAPNVVMVVLDDLGFSDFGCYGSGIATPNIDKLATEGLRYNRFHVTPLCAPSRACLLTGRNHHRVGVGFLTHVSSDYPGYTSRIPKSAGSVARVLRGGGFSTMAVGKWHLTPQYELGPTGPFDRWPLGMGFERFYGFLHGMTDQYSPELVRDNGFIEPPQSPDAGYHLTEDLATQAIRMIQDQRHARPDKPFFLYFAPGAVHGPHQVRPEWCAPYRHQFDDGWDVERQRRFSKQLVLGVVPPSTTLTDRPSWVSAWDRLPHDRKILFARQMEIYAGFVTHSDAQIGRLLEYLASAGVLDDTLVMVLSDNGAEGAALEGALTIFGQATDLPTTLDDLGGVGSYTLYPAGWALACNTPLRLWKCYTWLGGVRVPLIVRWPKVIAQDDRGMVRSQFAHAVDLAPTIFDATGLAAPETLDGVWQQPLDGRSLLGTFASADAPSPRTTQYFEMLGSRSIYVDGWKATTDHVIAEDSPAQGSRAFDSDHWALFCLDEDFSEAHDISAAEPHRLNRMIEEWWVEAGRNQVLPLFDSWKRPENPGLPRFPAVNPVRDRYLCIGRSGPIETPYPFARNFRFAVQLEIGAKEQPSGILCAHHVRMSGLWSLRPFWACYLSEGRPIVTFSVTGTPETIRVDESLPAGLSELGVAYTLTGRWDAAVEVTLNGVTVATGIVDPTLTRPTTGLNGMLLVGWGRGAPIDDGYRLPFDYTGHIERVIWERE
jgi:arylsulfatase A-like enzyme